MEIEDGKSVADDTGEPHKLIINSRGDNPKGGTNRCFEPVGSASVDRPTNGIVKRNKLFSRGRVIDRVGHEIHGR